MKEETDKALTATTQEKNPPKFFGSFIVDIFKILLQFNQLPTGIKKKF